MRGVHCMAGTACSLLEQRGSARVVTLFCLASASTPLIDHLRSGGARALAPAISMVENRATGWSDLLKTLFPHTGKARVIGLPGSPGSGKRTLVDQLRTDR